ncbi:decaprenyl-phosphate phosphoribosyltransferase [Candidatus Saccharibacteria bacterium]|nr:decaprenyl-phosphate phosphoribosyltransferase [Candidatus Saccharibacteria bacterium]
MLFRSARAILISARPWQWLKNLSLFAAAFFGGDLFKLGFLPKLFWAFVAFCLLSSTAYLINDIRDRKKDQKHPTKKKRPIASGELSVGWAVVVAAVLGIGTLTYTYISFNAYFFLVSVAFIILQLSYSFLIRDVIILDALWVAAAFVLRVYAGAFVIPTPISAWLILSVIGLSLLLAFGKRRSERTLLSKLHKRLLTRETLRHYPDTLLDSMIAMSSSYTALAYSIFAFQSSPEGASYLAGILPATLASPKWALLTVPLVLYGIARYLFVIYEKKEGESPEKVLITDLPLLAVVLVWVFTSFVIVYSLGD